MTSAIKADGGGRREPRKRSLAERLVLRLLPAFLESLHLARRQRAETTKEHLGNAFGIPAAVGASTVDDAPEDGEFHDRNVGSFG
jgi:hypothetical protein